MQVSIIQCSEHPVLRWYFVLVLGLFIVGLCLVLITDIQPAIPGRAEGSFRDLCQGFAVIFNKQGIAFGFYAMSELICPLACEFGTKEENHSYI